MKRIFHLLFVALIGTAFSSHSLEAQTVLDGAWIKEHNKTKKVIQYPFIREADVMFAKRIWQDIDLREKMNMPLYLH